MLLWKKMGIEPKAVLLSDNSLAHPDEEELILTLLIQPMGQGVIVSLMHHYCKRLLKELILHDGSGV